MNINDFFQESESAADAPEFAPLLGNAELPQGAVVLCELVYTDARTSAAGAPSFINKLKIVEAGHPLEGGEFFDSITLSAKKTDGAIGYNKRMFAKLGATGLGATFFSSNPSNEAVAKAMLGRKVKVTIKWQKPADDGRVWSEHTWSTADEAVTTGPAGFSAAPKGF